MRALSKFLCGIRVELLFLLDWVPCELGCQAWESKVDLHILFYNCTHV